MIVEERGNRIVDKIKGPKILNGRLMREKNTGDWKPKHRSRDEM